jgi:DNA-binding transcriptional ArsR family regulator
VQPRLLLLPAALALVTTVNSRADSALERYAVEVGDGIAAICIENPDSDGKISVPWEGIGQRLAPLIKKMNFDESETDLFTKTVFVEITTKVSDASKERAKNKTKPKVTFVGEIGDELEIPSSTLSHHLEKLKNEDLVNVRRERTFLWYSANTESLQKLLGFLYAECCTRNKAIEPGKIVVCK